MVSPPHSSIGWPRAASSMGYTSFLCDDRPGIDRSNVAHAIGIGATRVQPGPLASRASRPPTPSPTWRTRLTFKTRCKRPGARPRVQSAGKHRDRSYGRPRPRRESACSRLMAIRTRDQEDIRGPAFAEDDELHSGYPLDEVAVNRRASPQPSLPIRPDDGRRRVRFRSAAANRHRQQ